MWLPKDEREVLRHYYKKVYESGVETRGQIFLNELEKCLSGKNRRNRTKIASRMLLQRNLLAFFNDQHDAVTVQLTLDGYDLGRKYSSWWTRSGLWFAEYKNHWIWIIVSFLGGVIGGLLINWLSIGD
ncbi:MAG: hypothetical protein IIC00_09390 [Planctomycetes bacterium]|nr:hypothetical protein [Planctomycetota bacterium]